MGCHFGSRQDLLCSRKPSLPSLGAGLRDREWTEFRLGTVPVLQASTRVQDPFREVGWGPGGAQHQKVEAKRSELALCFRIGSSDPVHKRSTYAQPYERSS